MRALGTIVLTVTVACGLRAQAPDASVIAEGKKVFEGRSGGALCFSCHGMNAKGIPGVGPDLTDGTWLHGNGGAAFLDSIIRSGVSKPKQSMAAMPPMGGAKLTAAQLSAVAAYVASLGPPRK